MLYISVTCRGPATASRCWAKVNTVLAKHTPVLTSLPWLSLGQAPVSSTIKCSQLRSSSDTTPRKYVGNINKPLQIVSICNSKTIAYNVQHPLNEREHRYQMQNILLNASILELEGTNISLLSVDVAWLHYSAAPCQADLMLITPWTGTGAALLWAAVMRTFFMLTAAWAHL